MKRAESGETKATRQCWECLKRRLVCDHTLPHCNKCIKAGKDCPGYDEQKPLQWVEPGKVTSRRQKKDCPPKVYTIRPEVHGPIAPIVSSVHVLSSEDSSNSDSTETITQEEAPTLEPAALDFAQRNDVGETLMSVEAVELYESQLAAMLIHEEKAAWWDSMTAEEQTEHILAMAAKASAGVEAGQQIMRIGSQKDIRAVVERGQAWEAAMLLRSDAEPLEKLKRLLWIMEMNQLPSYEHLSNETSEVVQAVNYFNIRIYPDVKETDSLAPNPAVIHFPVWALHVLPPAMHHTLVCLSLNHYIHSLPMGSNRALLAGNRSKIYKYRGLAIRALSEYVARETTRSSDLTISSILMFMAMEVQNSSAGNWRSHAHGMKRLIDMRGGFAALMRSAPYLTSSLVIFIIIVSFSNSLGPAADQISITEPHEQHLKEVGQLYSLIFPYLLCPPQLFSEIIRINRLRWEVSNAPFDDPSQHMLDAHDILARIEAFEPEDWAQPGDKHHDWQLIGSIYQSAIALYCTMSLQAVGALPDSLEMVTMRSIHGERLLENLKASALSQPLKKFSLFPLCVLGVEAGFHNQPRTRVWIERRLEEDSQLLGTSSPLKARAVLRRYWQRKKPGWDECFDGPHTSLVPSVC